MPRLPVPGDDLDAWGALLNEFLEVEHGAAGAIPKLDNHIADTDNPHTVTRAQLSAAADDHDHTGGGETAVPAGGIDSTGATDGHVLTADGAGAAAWEAAAGGGAQTASGSYTGDGVNARQITVGFTPDYVFIRDKSSDVGWTITASHDGLQHISGHQDQTAVVMVSNGFQIGDDFNKANLDTRGYEWSAFG